MIVAALATLSIRPSDVEFIDEEKDQLDTYDRLNSYRDNFISPVDCVAEEVDYILDSEEYEWVKYTVTTFRISKSLSLCSPAMYWHCAIKAIGKRLEIPVLVINY